MDIPDSVDWVVLSEETLTEIAGRTGISTLRLYDLLLEDRERGVTSGYMFSSYNTPNATKTTPIVRTPTQGGNMDQIKKLWNERPIELMAAVAAVGIAASKVIDSVSSMGSRRAYAKQIRRAAKRLR